ncbi:GNAT family N-acetyltransferase [bacterium AH-315-M05]|nr:GNAT family N-acetyltransferase [bacterium AH-315-M05]
MFFGTKIKLRAIEPSDIDLLHKWENDRSIWSVSNTIAPFSRKEIEEYITSIRDIYADKQLRLMIVKNLKSPSGEGGVKGEIGCIDLFDFDKNNLRAGVGILIAEPSQRQKGYASEALELLIKYCFTILNLHQLYCNIPVDNEASIKLFKKHGFQEIGVKKDWIRTGNKWVDEYLFQLVNS